MKINEVIREKRKEQQLTQEQVAEYLGVSTPAVNKWEKGLSYPDITILQPLARLLKVDLNTLLCFDEELSNLEVTRFLNEISIITQKDGFRAAFNEAMKKIQKYPSSDNLILCSAMILQGSLNIFGDENKEEYEEKIEKLFVRASTSEDIEIKNQANSILISKFIERKEYEKAQSLIDTLPNNTVDKKHVQLQLYMKQNRNEESLKLLESKLINSLTEIQAILLSMIDIAHKENRNNDASVYADISEKTAKLYELWDFNLYTAKFQLAICRKDTDKCIEILNDMVLAMKKPWNISKTNLYKHIKTKENEDDLGKMMVKMAMSELQNNEELAFLTKDMRFKELKKKFEV